MISGCDTNMPSFMVALAQDFTQGTVGQHVIFQTVLFNKALGYSPRHGVFTAPTTGTYSFSATLTSPPGQSFHVAMVKNSYSNAFGYIYADPTNIHMERSTTVLTHLDASDEVWIACTLSICYIQGENNKGGLDRLVSTFSGFLVSAD